jgi:hypothetical protein
MPWPNGDGRAGLGRSSSAESLGSLPTVIETDDFPRQRLGRTSSAESLGSPLQRASASARLGRTSSAESLGSPLQRAAGFALPNRRLPVVRPRVLARIEDLMCASVSNWA